MLLVSLVDSTLIAPGDYSVPSYYDLLITSSLPEQLVYVSIFADRIDGEPVENFTISSTAAVRAGANDAMFLFRDSVINIVDNYSEHQQRKH